MDHFKFPSTSSQSHPSISPRTSSLSNPISSSSTTINHHRKKVTPTPLRLSNKFTSSYQELSHDSTSSSSSSRSPSILDQSDSIKSKHVHPLDERLSQEYNSIIINSKSSTSKLSSPSSPLRSMSTVTHDSPQLQRARITSFTQASSNQNLSSQESIHPNSNPIISSPSTSQDHQQQFDRNTIGRSNIGLGMPFSVSEASALHFKSLISPRTDSDGNLSKPSHPDPPTLFSPVCSPVAVDRTRLVGLGELATPRWSSIATKPNRQSDHQSSPQYTEPISRFRSTTSDWNHQFGSPLSPIQHHPESSLNSLIDFNDDDSATPQLGTLTKKKKKSKNFNEASSTPRYETMNWEDDVIGPYTDEDQQNHTTQTFTDPSSPLVMKQSQSHQQSDSGGPSKPYSHNALVQKNSRQGLEDLLDHEEHVISSPPFSAPGRATKDFNAFERMPNSANWTSNSFSILPSNNATENHDRSNPTLSSHSISHPNNHPKHRSQYSSSGEKPIKSGPSQSRGWDSHPEITEEPDKRTRNSISHVFQSPPKPTTQSSSNRYEPGQAYSIGLGVAGDNLSNSNPFNNNKPTFPSSSHFHHHSPSTIAHSILKSASSGLVNTELEVMDMEQAAAKNDDTAEALRKLDGLSTTSPRTSKQLTKESTGSRPTSSVSGGANRRPNHSRSNTPSSSVSGRDKDRSSYHHHSSTTKDKHKSGGEEHHLSPKKTRSRSLISSTKEQSSLFEAEDPTQDAHPQSANQLRSSFKPPSLTQPIPQHLSSAPSSSVSFPNDLSLNPNSPKTAFSRRGSQAKALDSDVLDWKRGSSSSTGGTNSTTNTVESRDSTLATSVSASSFHPARSPPTKRRTSIGSEASSVLSGNGGDGSEAGGGVEKIIPPVPPLPKDYETYKGHTYSLSNAQLNHPQPTSNRIQSHSFIQLPSPRRNSQQTLDSPCSKSFTGIGSPGGADGENTSTTGNTESLPSSATSRFLHSFTTPKNSEELTDLPSPSTPSNSTTITAKANKKWSLSAALGINRSPSFTKEQQVEDKHLSHLKKSGLSTMPMTKLTEMSSGPTIVHDNSNARDRTISNSSHQTDETSKLSGLSARRTPSGIPFFSRKSSSTHHSALNNNPGPGPEPEPSPRLESEGRKSMLGLNVFIRNSVGSRKPTVSISAGSSSAGSGKPARSPIDSKLSINVHSEDSKSKLSGSNSGNSSGPTSTMKKLTLSTKASNLIGRRRGKTVSAADPTKEAIPPPLPPMQMSAIDSSTIQRVDSFNENSTSKRRSGEYAINSSSVSIRGGMRVRSIKESTSSIRRGLLPTIDGSPLRTEEKREEPSEKFPSTPTKIPRAVFKTQPKKSLSPVGAGVGDDSQTEPVPDLAMNEFGMISHQASKRTSETVSLIPRTRSGLSISTTTGKSIRKLSNLDLKSSTDSTKDIKATEEKSSIGSENTSSPAAARLAAARRTVVKTTQESQANRLASTGLNSSRRLSSISNSIDHSANEFGKRVGVGGLASKLTLPSRMSRSSTTPTIASSHQTNDSSSSHQIIRAKSTQESGGQAEQVSEEELRGDEEMLAYVARQKSKKLANGMSLNEINKLFEIAGKIEPTKSLTTKEALRLYRNYLSDYEKVEILGFEEIYYVGAESNKKMANRLEVNQNFGYDDERGDYLIIRNDHLMFRYEIVDVLGKGSFGQVLQCRDHKTGEMVAIKIIRNKRRFHHQALVEIKVLENLLNWDPDDKHCVLKMTDHFSFRGHLCIVNELLSINLYELIRNNSFNGFSTVLIRRFTIQILQSLSLLRHHRVVHCDLKPENILLRHPGKSAIKTIDFGSSCFENEKVYTYIQSRFYRSPEVILGMNYHMAIDMWSLGCILAELYTGYPIFPGETESEQLACIMEVLGMPDKYLVDRSSRRKLFFDSTGAPRPVVNSKGRRRRVGSKSLSSVLKTDDELFLDFIGKCLAWDPERRLKPDPAMRHPWIIAGRSQRTLTSGVGSLRNQRGSSGILISSPRRKPTLNSSTTSTSSGNSGNLVSTNSSSNNSRNRTQSITVVGTGGNSGSSTSGNHHHHHHHHHNGSLRQSVPVKPVGS